jgi:TolB protein
MNAFPFRTLLTLALGVAALVLTVWQARQRMIAAATSETITWGANNPTWSPDGARLAFSLFGSIWEAPAEGGEARQVTASPGYHAHPAWSPDGARIAFVRGAAPAGRMPYVSGDLAVVEVATGAERSMATPFPVAGTPAWQPDSQRLVVPLRPSADGAVLYELALASGEARPIHQPPQGMRAGSAWMPVSVNARTGEVFFISRREGPAVEALPYPPDQVWTFKPGGLPMMVQLPVTRYKASDIAHLDGVAALPDGGVIYSGVEVNGKGDYELYRATSVSSAPVPVTRTSRDEFSPAVSPDGSRLAFVSNHLGNIDLFTMPAGGGTPEHVRLTGLEFRDGQGTLRLKLLDERGEPTAARLYVIASDGKAYCPPGNPVYYFTLEPGKPREGFFIADKEAAFPVPAGRVRLVALKGPEYRILDRTVDVTPGNTAEVTLTLERWTNWNLRGWYSGENHFHANYNGSYYQKPPQSLAWLEAEDLNAANMIVANSEGAFIHDKEFFRGAVDPNSTERYKLYWGQEYRNSYPLGHLGFLNIRKQVPPSFTSVPGSPSPYDYPLNTMAAREARQQGGLVTQMHPIGGAVNDVFDTRLGAKETPVQAALGVQDLIDVLPYAPAGYELWYRLLNCGFRITGGAGTDTFTNWRGINRIPGGARQYVEVGGPMDWDRWIERLREGRSFVTNGPLVHFEANGKPVGSVIEAPAGSTLTARLSVEVSAREPLRRIEFLSNGTVIAQRAIQGNETTARFDHEVRLDRSAWLAVRVEGDPTWGVADMNGRTLAHSSPVYVQLGGAPALVRDDLELMIRWIDRLWWMLEARDNFGSASNRKRARAMIDEARRHYQQKLASAR